ncbi:MAG TPA: hypothetical protein VFK35_12230 [Candidatus Limnocylindrales bacterium]|nr:hypothetical protein [Candidatus Limnocylindrales bacterium]
MDPTQIGTVADAVAAALSAYDALVELGEEIEDEWSYVNDLADIWRTRLEAVATARGHEAVAGAVATAIAVAGREAAAIDDPHRAIDWLSTYPQVVLIALDERP